MSKHNPNRPLLPKLVKIKHLEYGRECYFENGSTYYEPYQTSQKPDVPTKTKSGK